MLHMHAAPTHPSPSYPTPPHSAPGKGRPTRLQVRLEVGQVASHQELKLAQLGLEPLQPRQVQPATG